MFSKRVKKEERRKGGRYERSKWRGTGVEQIEQENNVW